VKVLIICFSQTGNTRKVAVEIVTGLEEAGDHCEIVDLKNIDPGSFSRYDLIGLGCPVFYYREPFHVSDFIEALPDQNGRQWFVFCSHGSVLGVTLHSMTESLQARRAKVIGSHHTYADGTIPYYPYPTVTTGHPDEQDLAEARAFGRKIGQCSKSVAQGDESCIAPPPPVTEEWVKGEIQMLTREFLGQVMPKLYINQERCSQCGECEDGCPVAGIEVSADPPRIQEPCILCLNCVKICPACAIETDWSVFVPVVPVQYAKYVKALNDAEARGEFRWRVDPESIDFEDPLYKQRLRALDQEKLTP
jgi:flavodoxin/ferredoxin